MNNYMKIIINSLKQWVNDMLTALDKKLTKRIDYVATQQDDMVKSVNNTLPDENGNVQITVGSEQIQADYEQNNPEATDYIKNRPFYIGEGTITEIFNIAAYMAENNLEWATQGQIDDTYAIVAAQLPVTIPVTEGETYTFIVDGVEYVETAQYITQGGMSGFMFGEAPADISNFTFYAATVPAMNMSMLMCKASALPTECRIVGISQEIKKLDKKFLPMPDDGYGWEEKTESEIVVEEQNMEGFAVLNEEIGTYSIELQKDEGFGFFDLQVNKTYTVVIDGVQYETTVNGCNRNGATTWVLGDYDAFWEGASSLTNEMPFYLYENANGEFGMGTKLPGESHTISVIIPGIITIHRINEKYLPPEKPIVQSDWNVNDSTLESYIKNRPFYEEYITENTIFDGLITYDKTNGFELDSKVIEEGKTYCVTIEDKTYICTGWRYKETGQNINLTWIGLGDSSMLGFNAYKEDVPFCWHHTTSGSLGSTFHGDGLEDDGQYYLKLAEYVLTQVHEMDDKYAPLLKRVKLLYPEQEIASTTGEEIISRYSTIVLKQDTVYRITFNGKEYELPSWVDNVGRIVVGSPEKHEGGGSAQSDIPFVLAYEEGNTPTEKLVRLVWDINTFASCILKIEEKYSETHSETILSLQTVNDFAQDENTSLYTAPINADIVLEEGVKYKVTWDGSVYETSCEVITMNDVPWYCIGNTGLLSNPVITDDNMPFVIFRCFFMGFGAVTQLDDVSHIVSIDKISEVNKIDSKYLPDNIGGGAQSDWSVNDENDAAYVKNRPFYTIGDAMEIAWDGDTSNITTSVSLQELQEGASFCYVSENVPSNDALKGAHMVVKDGGNEQQADVSAFWSTYEKQGLITDSYICILYFVVTRRDNTNINFNGIDLLFPIAGVYFLRMGEDTYISKLATTWSGKKLDYKYMPDEIVGRHGTGLNAEIFNDYENNIASGDYSHAEGGSTASGDYSHAEGKGWALGYGSHAEGERAAFGQDSHAEGVAGGSRIRLSGEANAKVYTYDVDRMVYAKAGDILVYNNNASKILALDSENGTIVVDKTLSDTELSYELAFVILDSAVGDYSHVEGQDTRANGAQSHAEGYGTVALNYSSHAEGSGTVACGEGAHAEGWTTDSWAFITGEAGTTTYQFSSYVRDENEPNKKFYIVYNDIVEEVVSLDNLSQTLVVKNSLTKDRDLSYERVKIVSGGLALGKSSHAENGGIALGDYSHASGESVIADSSFMMAHGRFNKYSNREYNVDIEVRSETYQLALEFGYEITSYEFDEEKGNFIITGMNSSITTINNIKSNTLYAVESYILSNGNAGITTEADGTKRATFIAEITSLTSLPFNTDLYDSYKEVSFITHKAGLARTCKGDYIEVVGNGTSDENRSNAHTIDWNGVGWFAGGLKVGGTGQDDGAKTVALNGDKEFILASSTEGSTKQFKITIDDTGTLTVTEVE